MHELQKNAARLDGEPADPGWAPRAAKLLNEDFHNLGSNGSFQVNAVDCKTTTCVADIAFTDHYVAMTHWKEILANHFSVPCGVRMVLDGEGNGAEPYPTRVLLDCEDARVGLPN